MVSIDKKPEDRPVVVVGVSDTSGSPTALEWAWTYAEQVEGTLVAVRAWKPPASSTPSPRPGMGPLSTGGGEDFKDAEANLVSDVKEVLGKRAEDVETRLVRGGRRKVLLDAAEDADMLVVDASPRGTVSGNDTVFARKLVYAAACPVVVMPPRVTGAQPSWLVNMSTGVGRRVVRGVGRAGRPGLPPVHP